MDHAATQDDRNCASLLNIDITAPHVFIKSIPGFTVQQAAHPHSPLFSMVLQHSPNVIILDLGANDLDHIRPETQSQPLLVRLQNLADALINGYIWHPESCLLSYHYASTS